MTKEPPRSLGSGAGLCPYRSRMRPSVEMTVTCQGMSLPQFWRARFTAFSRPPQQGTSMRTTVTLLISLRRRISVSLSA